jgi:hypothetical protein
LPHDLPDRPQPSGVDDANRPPLRVDQQDRNAIGEAHEQSYGRPVGQDGIGTAGRRIGPRLIGHDDFRRMDLPDVED